MFDYYDTLITPEEVADMLNCGMNTTYYVMRGNDLTSSESTKSTSSNNQHNFSASPNSDSISATELHSTPSALPETIFCPHCGKKIQRNSKFCCFCGSKINYKK